METVKLRKYQARLIESYNPAENTLLDQPTGSGKTLAIVTIVGRLLSDETRLFRNILIAAPQEQIEESFVHRSYKSVSFPDGQVVLTPDSLFQAARRHSNRSIRGIKSYLEQPQPFALVTTHSALSQFHHLPDDCSAMLLVLDEAHHGPAKRLGEFIRKWLERNGRLLLATATPYRSDGKEVLPPKITVLRRTLASHMLEHYAPSHLETSIVTIPKQGTKLTTAQFLGDEAPDLAYVKTIVAEFIQTWERDGRPKTIVRVPPIRGGANHLIKSLTNAFLKAGARVLNATGTESDDKNRVLESLRSERNLTHENSEIDVIIGIQRVVEGTDWPHCSTVYCLGLPGSIPTVVQLMGRATRKKPKSYPERHRDKTTIRFLTPVGDRSVFTKLSREQSRHTLLLCAFLADPEFGMGFLSDSLNPSRNEGAETLEDHSADNPVKRSNAVLAVTQTVQHLKSLGREPLVGEVMDLIRRRHPQLDESLVSEAIVRVLAERKNSSVSERTVRCRIKAQLRIRPEGSKAFKEVLKGVMKEFRDETLVSCPLLERTSRQAHELSGKAIEEWMGRMKDKSIDLNRIIECMTMYIIKNSKIPTLKSGPVDGLPGWTWLHIDKGLREGYYGLTRGSSIARLAVLHFGYRHVGNLPPLTIDLIIQKLHEFYRKHGRYPTQADGAVEGMEHETWKQWDVALRNGLRGLPKGSSLAKLRKSHFGDRNRSDLSPLTEEFIVECMKVYEKRHMRLPSMDSGAVEGMPGEIWKNWDFALRNGYRGLPGGSSLAKLKNKHFPPTRLTEAFIVHHMQIYKKKHGKLPTSNSGSVEAVPGATWQNWDIALRRGSFGLSGGSSLADLKRRYFRDRS